MNRLYVQIEDEFGGIFGIELPIVEVAEESFIVRVSEARDFLEESKKYHRKSVEIIMAILNKLQEEGQEYYFIPTHVGRVTGLTV